MSKIKICDFDLGLRICMHAYARVAPIHSHKVGESTESEKVGESEKSMRIWKKVYIYLIDFDKGMIFEYFILEKVFIDVIFENFPFKLLSRDKRQISFDNFR